MDYTDADITIPGIPRIKHRLLWLDTQLMKKTRVGEHRKLEMVEELTFLWKRLKALEQKVNRPLDISPRRR